MCWLQVLLVLLNQSRLCTRDEDVHFALNKFRYIRLDETALETRPHHGLALYVKEQFEIQKVVKHHSHLCEFIMTTSHSYRKGQLQLVVFYKYPKSSQTKRYSLPLRPVVDFDAKIVIMGDFNIPVNEAQPPFVHFMETLFNCHQCIH